MPSSTRPHWQELGHELRRLRSLAGLTTRTVAARTGLSNARVSRVELGQSLLSLPEIDAWTDAVGADAAALDRLRRLAERAHGTVEPFRTSVRQRPFLESGTVALEARAGRVVTVQPQVVPGLLQTAEYTRRLVELVDPTGRDPATAVAQRVRRQEVLYRRDGRFEFLITEAALRWPAGDDAVMAAQFDRILSVATLRTVRLGVIPLGVPVAAIPWCGIDLYDDLPDDEPAVVDVELPHGEVWVTEPADVAVYRDIIGRLWTSASTGAAATALIRSLGAAGSSPRG
jgi:transcriptional regulator with XRE-family HTH domain